MRVLDRPDPRDADVGGPRLSGLDCSGSTAEVELVEADLRDAEAVERGRRPASATPSSTSRRRRSSAPRRRLAAGDLRGQRRAAPGTCSRPAASTTSPAVVVASSDKAYGASDELPYREDFAAARRLPLRRQQGGGRRRSPAATAHAYGLPVAVTRFANVYGGGDLNFSRLIPETVERGARRPARR